MIGKDKKEITLQKGTAIEMMKERDKIEIEEKRERPSFIVPISHAHSLTHCDKGNKITPPG
ncbi:MAG: hypothetical protein D6736_01745 [Nitrospinota bacterium]|nr:MAG: hypothetical protein D6736_01745 [Nitrospinota bacterium]